MITGPIRGESVETDRVLLAAQLHNDGQHTAAWTVLASVVYVGPQVERQFGWVCAELREHQELVEQRRLCQDDPRHYADLHEDQPVHGSLLDYSEFTCTELDLDAAAALADARRGAESIAALADTAERAA
jgi:hypothetical protein